MGGSREVDLAGFSSMYEADPLYHWVGFDSPLMFAAHKAAGGMTSIYRQLGIGCERLFRQILRDQLQLNAEQVKWSYQLVPEPINSEAAETEEDAPPAPKARVLALDGRVELADIRAEAAAEKFTAWIEHQKTRLDITAPLKGAVFEVRQGYKSADSKRQNADLSNAAQALGHGFLPTLVIMSAQINQAVRARYEVGNWAVLMGKTTLHDPTTSTFDFINDVVGYDITGFFERNSSVIRDNVEEILTGLLEAK